MTNDSCVILKDIPTITITNSDNKPPLWKVTIGNNYKVTNLANVSSLLWHELRATRIHSNLNWVGFYITDPTNKNSNSLLLGPFQGKIACTSIAFGRGVCGTAALQKKTLVVPNVHLFPGHIACDSNSNSEIVVPLLLKGSNDKVIGVLDLDCEDIEAFDESDVAGLEAIATRTNKDTTETPVIVKIFRLANEETLVIEIGSTRDLK
ncbi:14426_t:CDS:2, partial [Ambispora leptoticha]